MSTASLYLIITAHDTNQSTALNLECRMSFHGGSSLPSSVSFCHKAETSAGTLKNSVNCRLSEVYGKRDAKKGRQATKTLIRGNRCKNVVKQTETECTGDGELQKAGGSKIKLEQISP